MIFIFPGIVKEIRAGGGGPMREAGTHGRAKRARQAIEKALDDFCTGG